MLKQLPKSMNWEIPSTITSVRAKPADKTGPHSAPARVLYSVGSRPETIPCDSFEEACQIRDEIAAMVNESPEQ